MVPARSDSGELMDELLACRLHVVHSGCSKRLAGSSESAALQKGAPDAFRRCQVFAQLAGEGGNFAALWAWLRDKISRERLAALKESRPGAAASKAESRERSSWDSAASFRERDEGAEKVRVAFLRCQLCLVSAGS